MKTPTPSFYDVERLHSPWDDAAHYGRKKNKVYVHFNSISLPFLFENTFVFPRRVLRDLFFHFEANSYLHILFGGVVVDHVPLAFFFCFLFSCWFSTKGGRTINLCLFQFFLWVLFVPFRNRFCKTKSKKEKRRTSTLVACVSLWPNATCSFHYKKKKKQLK